MHYLFQWIKTRGYRQGAFWIIVGCLASNVNDMLMKHISSAMPTAEIIFFRFLFCGIILLPLMLPNATGNFKVVGIKLHVNRIILGALAMGLSCYSTSIIPLADVTALSFSQPLFFLPLAIIFLHERFDYKRLVATIIGFIGVLFIINPHNLNTTVLYLAPIAAAILFALMDLTTKKLMDRNNYLAISFYFAIGAAILCIIPTYLVWKTPTAYELLFLSLLGLSSNLIQLCVCMSFNCAEITSLAPFRYIEIVFSTIFGLLIFNEAPRVSMLIGVALIIYSVIWLSYKEVKQNAVASYS
jgi:S-adenosylmethionine uptake transporter